MPNVRIMMSVALLALLSGCDDRSGPPVQDAASSNASAAGLREDVAEIGASARLDQATKRIDELERAVAHLKSTPATLDLELLDQRVQAIEARLAMPIDSSTDASPGRQKQAPVRPANSVALPGIEKQR